MKSLNSSVIGKIKMLTLSATVHDNFDALVQHLILNAPPNFSEITAEVRILIQAQLQ